MKRDWKPGGIALVTHQAAHPQVELCLRGITNNGWMPDDGGLIPDEVVVTARPLVVLDLSPHEVMRALEALRASRGMVAMQVADKLEEAAKVIAPPKPPEPTGLGAVVEDERGELWIRRAPHRTPWLHAEGKTFPQKWPDIAAVRVLSEGVDERRTP